MENAVKKTLLVTTSLAAMLANSLFAQSLPGLSNPTRADFQSLIGGMGLSMEDKLSLRKILQAMQEQGDKIKEDKSLTTDQKVAKIIQVRQNALSQTKKLLTPAQQQQMTDLLLPKPQ